MSDRADAKCDATDQSASEHHADIDPLASWPYQSYLELGAFPSAVPSARLHTRLILSEWGLAELADTTELVASELMTNAVQASHDLTGSRFLGRWSPGPPPVRLWLQADERRLLVQVWDGSDHMPQARQSELLIESGRGLVLIEALSTRVGVYEAYSRHSVEVQPDNG
jgi:anti-sigma regulatory factor (Ser/Thr protein kinase)